MVDNATPIYRSLAEAARRIPSFRNGKSTHPATLTRWILLGVQLQDGNRLKLEARRFPAGWAVTDEAIDAFVSALTRDRCGEPVDIALPRLPASRQRAIAQAEAELARAGI